MARSVPRKPRRSQRGLSLLEAVFAVAVLSTGVVAVFGMMNRISTANRSMAFQTSSLDAFARLAAEIRDARCVFPAEDPSNVAVAWIDPGLTIVPNTWQALPVGGSTIQFVGDFTTQVPALNVTYRVTPDAAVTPTGAPAFDIDVRVREIMRDPLLDDPNRVDGYWIQVFPVKKMCALRADATARGEY